MKKLFRLIFKTVFFIIKGVFIVLTAILAELSKPESEEERKRRMDDIEKDKKDYWNRSGKYRSDPKRWYE